MGLLDGAFSAADDTGGFLSKLARQNRTPADTVAQRFPTAQPGWLQPVSMFGSGAPLPLFPPLPTQPGAAAPQSPPAPDLGVAPGMNAPADQGALAGPWTAFQQPDAPSVAPGPWTEFQAQPSTIAAASNGTDMLGAGTAIPKDGQSLPQPNYARPLSNWLGQGDTFMPQPSDQQLAAGLAQFLNEQPAPAPQPSLWDQIKDRFIDPLDPRAAANLHDQIQSGWPVQYLNHVAHGIGDWLKTPGRVAQHGMTPEDVEWGPATALGMVGGGAAFARPGTIGMAGGRLTGGGSKLPMDEASVATRMKEMDVADEPFYRGEASGNLPDEYPGGGHFSRDPDYARSFAQRGGQSEPREFRLNLTRTFSDADPLTAEQYGRLVGSAEPKLAGDLVDMVAPGKDPAWFQEFAKRKPDFQVTAPGTAKFIRDMIFKNSSAPEQVFTKAGYDALDSGRDVRKLAGEGIRLKSAEFDPAKRNYKNINAALAGGAVAAPALLAPADPRSD